VVASVNFTHPCCGSLWRGYGGCTGSSPGAVASVELYAHASGKGLWGLQRMAAGLCGVATRALFLEAWGMEGRARL
jgi:hypothetical protein